MGNAGITRRKQYFNSNKNKFLYYVLLYNFIRYYLSPSCFLSYKKQDTEYEALLKLRACASLWMLRCVVIAVWQYVKGTFKQEGNQLITV